MDIIQNLEEIFKKYEMNKIHSVCVRNFSVKIFDFLKSESLIDIEKKYILEYASLLHDIGRYYCEKSHHKVSFSTIMNENLKEVSDEDKLLIALIARYHRASLPNKKKHIEYATIEKYQRKIVKILAGILRIADGLSDKTQRLINDFDLQFNRDKKQLIFYLHSNLLLNQNTIRSVLKKKNLLEKVLNLEVVFKREELS